MMDTVGLCMQFGPLTVNLKRACANGAVGASRRCNSWPPWAVGVIGLGPGQAWARSVMVPGGDPQETRTETQTYRHTQHAHRCDCVAVYLAGQPLTCASCAHRTICPGLATGLKNSTLIALMFVVMG